MKFSCEGRCLTICLYLLLAVNIFMIGVMGYWWLLDVKVNGPWFEFHSAEVVTPKIYPGEALDVEYKYSVHRPECDRVVEIWLFNGGEKLLRSHTGRTSGIKTQNPIHAFRSHTLPILAPGQYSIRVKSTGYCTPLRNPEVYWTPDIHFEVIR